MTKHVIQVLNDAIERAREHLAYAKKEQQRSLDCAACHKDRASGYQAELEELEAHRAKIDAARAFSTDKVK